MCAVPDMTVFCSSLMLCFPGMLLWYFLNDAEIVSIAPIITGITLVFIFHMCCISVVRSVYFRIFSVSLHALSVSWNVTYINIYTEKNQSITSQGIFIISACRLLQHFSVQQDHLQVTHISKNYEEDIVSFGWSIRGGADKPLARPGRKQATATKLGIYSTYSPRSWIYFLARCSNLWKPLKKN